METPFYFQISSALTTGRSRKNIYFSPIAIKICLALAYLGADGNTAEEIKQSLSLFSDTRDAALEEIQSFLKKIQSHNGAPMKIINRVFVNTTFKIKPKYNKLLSSYLHVEAENIDFKDNALAVKRINDWVDSNTENRIKNLLSPTNIDMNTACVLVNAIYFEAEWTKKFDIRLTEKRLFTISKNRQAEVNMMFQIDDFQFGQITNLDAYAIELPYKSSDMSMLVLLPKAIDGLAALENKLKSADFIKLSSGLKLEKLHLGLPKFKFEYDISLQPILEDLGMKTMFLKTADFSNLLDTNAEFFISEVKHKTQIEVNEIGTKTTDTMPAKIPERTSFFDIRDFIVDHPFFFAIKDKGSVYFAGHVATFEKF